MQLWNRTKSRNQLMAELRKPSLHRISSASCGSTLSWLASLHHKPKLRPLVKANLCKFDPAIDVLGSLSSNGRSPFPGYHLAEMNAFSLSVFHNKTSTMLLITRKGSHRQTQFLSAKPIHCGKLQVQACTPCTVCYQQGRKSPVVRPVAKTLNAGLLIGFLLPHHRRKQVLVSSEP